MPGKSVPPPFIIVVVARRTSRHGPQCFSRKGLLHEKPPTLDPPGPRIENGSENTISIGPNHALPSRVRNSAADSHSRDPRERPCGGTLQVRACRVRRG